jgi:branched-chain amino acid aminotransferase
MTQVTAYMNGEFIPNEQAKIDPLDRGYYLGDAVFDIARTYEGRPFKLREHTERLYRSLKYVRIDPGIEIEEMIAVSEELVRRNEQARIEEAGDWYVWQGVTRGVAATRIDKGPATVLIITKPVPWLAWGVHYRDGAHAVITRTRTYSGQSLEPKIKHYSRMNFNLAELEAQDVDPNALPVLLDTSGNVAEGVGYNVAIVKDGVIKTPGDDSILQGVSRATMFEVASDLGIEVRQEALQPYDVYTADEVFFNSTGPFVVPVTRVDKRPIGDGRPGPVVAQLLAAFSERVGIDLVDQMERRAGVR